MGLFTLKIELKPLLLLAFLFVVSTSFGQQENALDKLLMAAFISKDSSEVYFQKAEKRLKTRADTLSYEYFRFFKNDRLQNTDSTLFYSKKLIPAYLEVDSLERLRKIYERLHFQYLRAGNYEKSLFYIQKTIGAAEKLKDTVLISIHLSDKSSLFHDFENYKKGVKIGKKAYRLMETANPKAYKYLIFANNSTAINFDDWNKPDSALSYHYKNLELLKKVKDTARFGFVLNNIGNTLLKAKQYNRAKKMIKRALVLNKIRESDYSLAANYINLATIAYKENDFQLAENYFAQADKYAKLSESIEKIRNLAEERTAFYKKKGDYKAALKAQAEFYELRDSVFNKERATKFAELETRYQMEKKENQILQQKAQLKEKDLKVKRKNILFYGSLGVLALITLLGYLLYNQQKLKNRQLTKDAQLRTALATIETQNKLQKQRLRISRDLHDNIGAQLTFIISSLDTVKYGFPELDEKLKHKLSCITGVTSKAMYELRDTIWAMNKAHISFEDLQARIANFIESAEKSFESVDFSFGITDEIHEGHGFSSEEGMNVYRIIQEAINNALKHAEASMVKVDISRMDDAYQISISDNGNGFENGTDKAGNGLNNMRKRAKAIGAEITIASKKGEGTVVSLDIKKQKMV